MPDVIPTITVRFRKAPHRVVTINADAYDATLFLPADAPVAEHDETAAPSATAAVSTVRERRPGRVR